MKKLRVLALMHEGNVPPAIAAAEDAETAPWRTEYDVLKSLGALGHEVHPLAMAGELDPIRRAVAQFKPHIAFYLLESFDDVATWDQNVVGYLELMGVRYTGCGSRGLLLGRDKAVAKKLLSYHRIKVAGSPWRPAADVSGARASWSSPCS